MLYELTTKGNHKKITRTSLSKIGWKEEDLEKMLLENIDDFISERTLMPIFKQRKRQEEPDIMAIDKIGNIYIFELKRWVSDTENLLQVLRYGQLYGSSNYEDLNLIYNKYTNQDDFSLKENHCEYFGLDKSLREQDFNLEQNFVVVTNGMDQKSIEAIEYWRSQGLKIGGLIYWVYEIDEKSFIEIDRYMPDKNMLDYETNNYILNTNCSNDPKSHDEMINRKIAAAYVSGWKEKIDKLQDGDNVFLYKSGTGIVAVGQVEGKRKSEEWNGRKDDKYYVDLKDFKDISCNAISPSEMKDIRGRGYSFRTTMYSVDDETCKKLEEEVNRRFNAN